MTGLWGYANQLIAVIAVIAILEAAVEEPFRGRTKEGDVWKCGGEGVLESHWRWFIQAADCKAGFVLLSKTHSHQIFSCFVSELSQCGYSWTFPRALSAGVELKKLAGETEPFSGNLLAWKYGRPPWKVLEEDKCFQY